MTCVPLGLGLIIDNVLNVFDVSCCVYIGRNLWGDFLDTVGGVVPWGRAIRLVLWVDFGCSL